MDNTHPDPHAAAMQVYRDQIVRCVVQYGGYPNGFVPSIAAYDIADAIIALDRPVPTPGPPGDHMTAIMRLCGDLADRGDEQTWLMTQAIIEHAVALEDRPVPPVPGEDHAGAIRQRCHRLGEYLREITGLHADSYDERDSRQSLRTVADDIPEIVAHADALAAQLRASEARVERLQRHIVALEEWAAEDAVDQYATYKNVRSGGPGCELQPGDLSADGEGDGGG